MANNFSSASTSSTMNINGNLNLGLSPFPLKLNVDSCLREIEERRTKLRTSSIFHGASASSLGPLVNTRIRFLFEKELTRSDVNTVGRIVLPKNEAEAKLPILDDKWGIGLFFRDALSSDIWIMKYRFWPNNRGRMYVLENTGEFISKYNLTAGDSVAIYQDGLKQNFICAKKRGDSPYPFELDTFGDTRTDDDQIAMQRNEHMVVTQNASSTIHDATTNRGHALVPMWNQSDSWDSCFSFNDGFANLNNQNPAQCPRFSGLDYADLFLFDFRPDDDTVPNRNKNNMREQ